MRGGFKVMQTLFTLKRFKVSLSIQLSKNRPRILKELSFGFEDLRGDKIVENKT